MHAEASTRLAAAYDQYTLYCEPTLRDRVFGQAPPLEDAPVALVERTERIGQRLAAVIELLARGEHRFLVRGFVHQPVLPFGRIAVVADGVVERGCAAAYWPRGPIWVVNVQQRQAGLVRLSSNCGRAFRRPKPSLRASSGPCGVFSVSVRALDGQHGSPKW